MGQEISSATFCKSDFKEFANRLQIETDILKTYFAEDVFDGHSPHLGVELEGCLVDQYCNPAAMSEHLIAGIKNNKVVPELAKFNFEINSKAIKFGENCLQNIHKELDKLWSLCCLEADKLDIYAVAIGILPTYQREMLNNDNIYPYQRYYALEEELAKYRHGKPIPADIHGVDNLCENFNSLLFEAVTTSFQIHIQMGLSNSVRMYNAAQIISAPMIAVSANSPFLLGKNLWSDTRIPVFEQAAAIPYSLNGKTTPLKRVTFGHRFVEQTLFELFEENLKQYLILLPELAEEPETMLHHVRLHNGTIWRWNRPLIGFDNANKPNLRIEHRVNPAGPSIADNVANLALFLGLIAFYGNTDAPPENEITFKDAEDNFYRAAKYGLDCDLVWLKNKKINMTTLLLEEILPNAKSGLIQLGVDTEEVDYYLNLVEQRVLKRLTGSEWQRKFVSKYGYDFNNMLYNYLENQMKHKAVHQWKI